MKRIEMEHLLPGIFQQALQEGTPLSALLDVMEILLVPVEAILDQLDTFFDPYRTPDVFVPYLASWVDLERFLLKASDEFSMQASPPLPGGLGQLRELVAAATLLAQWRGTAKGLLRFLETATGVQGFTLEEQVRRADGQLLPFHLRVHVPSSAAVYRVLIEGIIESEKPAYVTYELKMVENTNHKSTTS